MSPTWSRGELGEVGPLRDAYFGSLRGPQEAWLEEQVHVRDNDFHVLTHDGRRIGYCCVDRSNRLLLQFCVAQEFSSVAVGAFELLLTELGVTRAYVTTRDPLALSLCLTFQKSLALESFLFDHRTDTEIALDGVRDARLRLADRSDAVQVVEVSGDFFGDVESEIDHRSLYVLHGADALLGVGYRSSRFCSGRSANLGMFTNPSFRRRNVGACLLQELVKRCREDGLTPIAACYHENPASKRTLEKAGFVSLDRTFLVSF